MTFTSWQFGVFVAIVFAAYYLPAAAAVSGPAAGASRACSSTDTASRNCCALLARRGARNLSLPGRWHCENRAGLAAGRHRLQSRAARVLQIQARCSSIRRRPAWSASAPLDFLLKLPLPIGISFFVFHNISLLVDLTRQKHGAADAGRRLPLHHLLSAAGFRPDHARGTCSCRRSCRNISRTSPFVEAAKWILTGFFFKLYVANNLNEMTSYMELPALRDAADPGPLAAGFPLQLSDLRRLLRLFGDRDRPRAAVRLSPADQLQSALYLDLVLRVLDALAYLAVDLAADLSLRPPRRQPPWDWRTYLNLMIVMGLGGALARRGPQLRCAGPAARAAAGARTALPDALLRSTRAGAIERRGMTVFFSASPCSGSSSSCRISIMRSATSRACSRRPPIPIRPKLFYSLALLYALPVLIQHLGIQSVLAGDVARAEPYLYGAMAALMCTRRRVPNDVLHLFPVLGTDGETCPPLRWLIKCGAGAAIVLIACGFATVRFGSGLQMPATTTRDGTLIALSRYLQASRCPMSCWSAARSRSASGRNILQRPGCVNSALAGALRSPGLRSSRTSRASRARSGRGECSRPPH